MMVPPSNIVRLSVSVVVEIDRAKWASNYGVEEGVEEIREVVKRTADELVQEHFERVGVLAVKE